MSLWLLVMLVVFAGFAVAAQFFKKLRKLKDQTESYSIIFNNMHEGLVVHGSDGSIVQFNQAALEILRLSEEELLGKTSVDSRWKSTREDGAVFPGNEHPAMIALKEKRKVLGVIMGVETPSGDKRWIKINAVPVPKQNPKTNVFETQVYVTFSDITEMKKGEWEYRQTLEAISNSAIVAMTDKSGNIIHVNDNFCEISGYSKQELMGKNHRILNSGFHPKSYFEEMWTTITQGRVWTGEVRNRRKGGGFYFVHTVITPIKDKFGQIDRFLSIRFDISRVRELEKTLQTLIDNSPGVICQIQLREDLTLSMPYVATNGLSAFGVSIAAYKENPSVLLDLINENDRNELLKKLTESYRTLEPVESVVRMELKNGSLMYSKVLCRPIRLSERGAFWSGFLLDVTQEKALETSLAEERIKAVHAAKLASLGEMSSGIAHEINNPLAIISGANSILKSLLPKTTLEREGFTFSITDLVKFESKVESIERSIARISKIITGLRKFSRTSHLSQDLKVHKIAKIIEESSVLFDAKVKQHQVELRMSLQSQAEILCDEIEIEQVLVNLINNAVDAVKLQENPWVQLSCLDEGSEVIVRVMDSGKGIPPEVVEKLFQPFFTTKVVGEGTGLGLSISRGILEQHRSSLVLNKSFPNTCFEMRFKKVMESTKVA